MISNLLYGFFTMQQVFLVVISCIERYNDVMKKIQ